MIITVIGLAAAAGLFALDAYEERKKQQEISEYFKRWQEENDFIEKNLKVGMR